MKLGITMLIHNKDDIEFVTEFQCLLGHPVFRYKWLRFLRRLAHEWLEKINVDEMLSDPPFLERQVRFTTVPLKAMSGQNEEWDNHILPFQNSWFSILDSIMVTCAFLQPIQKEQIIRIKHIQAWKTTIFSALLFKQ